VQISTAQPLFFDPYKNNHGTGSFILIDPHTNGTVAAGMIRGEVKEIPQPEGATAARRSPDVVWQGWNVTREEREARQGHQAAVLWFTGLSGAGKTTIASEVERWLFERGCRTMLLDGDTLRHGLCGDLGFSADERTENIRRAGEVARLFFEQGSVVLCTFVSPFREDRERVRALFPEGRFFEIHVDCDLDTLKQRDTKGLYARAERGEVWSLSGVSSPFEAPERAELVIDTAREPLQRAVPSVLHLIRGLVAGL
jgi:bifunctional enzyme CysN/CysC